MCIQILLLLVQNISVILAALYWMWVCQSRRIMMTDWPLLGHFLTSSDCPRAFRRETHICWSKPSRQWRTGVWIRHMGVYHVGWSQWYCKKPPALHLSCFEIMKIFIYCFISASFKLMNAIFNAIVLVNNNSTASWSIKDNLLNMMTFLFFTIFFRI